MSFVAVAIGTSAAVGVGGSLASGVMSRNAAKEGAALTADAAMRAERGLTDRSDQALDFLQPYRDIGVNAGNSLAFASVSPQERARQAALQQADLEAEVQKLSQGTDWASFPILTGKNASERRAAQFSEVENARVSKLRDAQGRLDALKRQAAVNDKFGDSANTFTESPAFKFQSEIGGELMDRKLSSMGLSKSGAGAEILRRFVTGLTAEESDRQTNRLQGLFQVGANASSNMASTLSNFAPPIANTQIQQGQAQAAGVLGGTEAMVNGITGATNAVTGAAATGANYSLANALVSRNSSAPNIPPAWR